MGSKRILNKKSLRNLQQYKDLSDEEFEEIMAKKALDLEPVKEFEDRIQIKLNEFAQDYDTSDMKINDRESLRALAQAFITLEDLETFTYKLRMEGITDYNLNLMDKIGRLMSTIRSDISKLQDDLKMTRKARKGDKEESVIAFLDDLKKKAKDFYDQKMAYVFCPECNTLVSTVWTLYPKEKNKFYFICKSRPDGEHYCNTEFTVTSKELLEKRGTNNREIVPESMT